MGKNPFGKIEEVHAKGVTFKNHNKGERQGVLWNAYRKQKQGVKITAWLRREPHNSADSNAIAIILSTGDPNPGKVGYVPREIALWLAPLMDKKRVVRAYNPKVVGNIYSTTQYKQWNASDSTLGLTFDLCYEVDPSDHIPKNQTNTAPAKAPEPAVAMAYGQNGYLLT